MNLGNRNMDHRNEERYGEKIAESLNGLNTVCELYFKVTQRSVRDRYKLLVDNFEKRARRSRSKWNFSRGNGEWHCSGRHN